MPRIHAEKTLIKDVLEDLKDWQATAEQGSDYEDKITAEVLDQVIVNIQETL